MGFIDCLVKSKLVDKSKLAELEQDVKLNKQEIENLKLKNK